MPDSPENSRINIRLFGPVQMNYEGHPPIRFRSNPQRALLTFLAMETGRPNHREAIHALIWPNLGESKARNNLRVTLSRLRAAFSGEEDFIRVTGNTIALEPAENTFIDVHVFLSLVKTTRSHQHPDGADCLACVERNRRAVDLVQGEFAEGLVLDQNIPFMEWLAVKREWLHREVLMALYDLTDFHMRRGELQQAATYAHRQLELEPWREEAHRQLMSVFARSGQRSTALAQYQKLEEVLAEELGVEPSAETHSLYERIRGARRRPAPELTGMTGAFIGRQAELAQMIGYLSDPDCRLLTISGPGGVGKTRLALKAAEKHQHAYLDGVVVLALGGVHSPQFLVSAISNNLGVPPHRKAGLKDGLIDFLRGREMLLVLDNFEHLRDGSGLLVDILDAAPGIKLLVTSRERLNLSVERFFVIEGLRYPESDSDEPPENFGAVQLFADRAQRVMQEFSLESTKTHVAAVCRLLVGMPLGIELAAARVREFECREIVRGIQQSLDFLSTAMMDVSPRHRSLRAAFNHSWELLSEEEQRIFRRLAVFRSGFDRAAAAAVSGASRAALSAFADKSLLHQERAPGENSSTKYSLHELIRQFAAEKLDYSPVEGAQNEAELVGRLHCNYFARFIQERDGSMRNERMSLALSEVLLEIDNVRAAWNWALDHEMLDEARAFLYVMLHLYEIQGWFAEAEEVFRRSVQVFEPHMSDPAGRDKGVAYGLGLSLFLHGWYAMRISNYALAEASGMRALQIARDWGDRELEAYSLDGLGVTAKLKGAYAIARQHLHECYRICKEIDLQWLAGGALANLGDIAIQQGDYPEAKRLLEESLVIHERLLDRWGIATRTFLLGDLAVRMGELERAEALIKESLAVHEEIGQRWRIADPKSLLGRIAARRGNLHAALSHYEESLELIRETGDLDRAARVLSLLGEINLALGRPRDARRQFREALDTAVKIQAQPVIGRAMLGMATLLLNDGQLTSAVELIAVVLQSPAAEQSVKERAETLLHELEVELGAGPVSEALEEGKKKRFSDFLDVLVGRR